MQQGPNILFKQGPALNSVVCSIRLDPSNNLNLISTPQYEEQKIFIHPFLDDWEQRWRERSRTKKNSNRAQEWQDVSEGTK